MLEANGEQALKDLVENYRSFYSQQRKYHQAFLDSGVYTESDGIQLKSIPIDGPLRTYIQSRVKYWRDCYVELQTYCQSNSQSPDRFAEIAKLTILRMALFVPQIFHVVCQKLRRSLFATAHEIDIFELQCQDWVYAYKHLAGANLGGDYVRILIFEYWIGLVDFNETLYPLMLHR